MRVLTSHVDIDAVFYEKCLFSDEQCEEGQAYKMAA